MTTYTIDRDRNGNRIVRVTVPGYRVFTIQTLANLPQTHRRGICSETAGEVAEWVELYGTVRQKTVLAAAPDVLSALQACEAELAHHIGEDRCQRAATEAVQIAQLAIAKAIGGAR